MGGGIEGSKSVAVCAGFENSSSVKNMEEIGWSRSSQ